jgi:hypothetical protein
MNDLYPLIMLEADIYTVISMYKTCKLYLSYKQDKTFWIKKFNYDQLPILCYVYHHIYPIHWVSEYIACLRATEKIDNLWKLQNCNNFTSFYTCNIISKLSLNNSLNFLPKDFISVIDMYQNDEVNSIELRFELHPCLGNVTYVGLDDEQEDYVYITMGFDPTTIKDVLIKMVYYLPQVPLDIL